jgi:putative nucleotidyltransferase with HDIG domain
VSGNISFIPFLSALALSPSIVLVLSVVLVVYLSEKAQRRESLKAVFNAAQYALSMSSAILAYKELGGGEIDPIAKKLYAAQFVAGFITFLVINTASVSWVIATAQSKRFIGVWRQVAGGAVLYDLFAVPVVYGFGYVFARWGSLPALGVAVPLFGLRQLYKTNYQLETLNKDLLQLIVSTVEARDPYTSGHSERVAKYAAAIGKATGVSHRDLDRFVRAALLHDIGKIHEEFAAILRKPGRLDADEFEIMKTHAAKGAALVSIVSQFRDLVPAIHAHHEAWDGHGYPDGTSGTAIPLAARIIAIADTIDAMSTDRPYRAGLAAESIRSELRAQRGRQFDPELVDKVTDQAAWLILSDMIVAQQRARHNVLPGERHSEGVELGSLSVASG